MDTFDPYAELAHQLGRPVDHTAIRAKRRHRFAELIADQSILPGVQDCILEARKLGLRLGLASSSSRDWVTDYLMQLGLDSHFEVIKCGDEVERTKPDPALYVAALQALKVRADEAIALEDSANGVLAAKRAGLYCVAVPNPLTRHLTLEMADVQVPSLADLPLQQLLAQANAGGG
jgi:HAD superfamily hydrolase (TIGR01509 family)